MAETAARRQAALPVLVAKRESGSSAAAVNAGARISIVTLGCDKNTVDTERILARLHAGGGMVGAGADGADVLVINTCGFIDVAKEESVDAIVEAVRLKQDGRVRVVVAMGCLVQRYKEELRAELPEVDLFLGLTEAERLVPELRARGLLPEIAPVSTMERPLRLLSTSTRHTSYLKISEGCDHGCAFCAIPLMRGKHRSTPIDTLVREAAELESAGVVELNIVSQDTTWYGRDRARGVDSGGGEFFVGKEFPGMVGPSRRASAGASASRFVGVVGGDQHQHQHAVRSLLPDLLRALLAGTSLPWFRLFYMYPSGITRELVDLIARESRILPYLDMPIQHGSDRMLVLMRRPERRATIRERVSWLRDALPELTLRTTVIVGFPGETEDDFEALLELLEEIRFDRLGAFAYSVEENTRAATMDDQVPEAVRRERLERVLDLQRVITLERNEAWVGRDVPVLIDRLVGRSMEADGLEDAVALGAIGRTKGQALEVDGVVHITEAAGARAGEFTRVRITEALEDDLVGARVAANG
jgi:ribosomal protein S12 methylthiotransferase